MGVVVPLVILTLFLDEQKYVLSVLSVSMSGKIERKVDVDMLLTDGT